MKTKKLKTKFDRPSRRFLSELPITRLLPYALLETEPLPPPGAGSLGSKLAEIFCPAENGG